MRLSLTILAAALLQLPAAADSPTARLKELVSLEGVRDNQLIGYGMVVGLKGTGDRQQTLFTAQSLTNMLQQMGVTVNPTLILVKNTASVMVTATLPPFAQSGMQIDATVAAMGDCRQFARRPAADDQPARHRRSGLFDCARAPW